MAIPIRKVLGKKKIGTKWGGIIRTDRPAKAQCSKCRMFKKSAEGRSVSKKIAMNRGKKAKPRAGAPGLRGGKIVGLPEETRARMRGSDGET